jgi:hypothetical protein
MSTAEIKDAIIKTIAAGALSEPTFSSIHDAIGNPKGFATAYNELDVVDRRIGYKTISYRPYKVIVVLT